MINLLRLRFVALLVSCMTLYGTAVAENVVFYIAPNGSASASGTSARAPLADLQNAIDKGLAGSDAKRHLQIRVAPGTYQRQTVKLDSQTPEYERIEISRSSKSGRPEFDGEGSVIPWLTIVAGDRPAGRVSVLGLKIADYSTAITLNGSRDVADDAVTDVVIRNSIFSSIGQQSPNQKTPSTAAVRLVNADRVKIVNNQFIDIRNRQRCGLLHSIYVAHGSTNNVIEGNTFENACGDALRFRDRSSANRVEGNTFIDAWAEAPISDWYCDSSARKDCSKKYTECPSFDNSVGENKIVVRKAKPPQAIKTFGPDTTSACPLPTAARGAAAQRFISR